MSESATPDDYDYLSDAPPATDDDETSFVADDEPSVPIARPRPVAEVRKSRHRSGRELSPRTSSGHVR